ncbi:MAG: DNA polymerase III subunit [Candidatus Omnitrophota bacterium]
MPFSDIIGHESVVQGLKEMFRNGRLAPVYIFSGPEGIGKRKTALELVKLINCAESGEEPCGKCAACAKIGSMNFPDLSVVTPSGKANRIGIDEVREIKRQASMRPFEGAYKVFIIDGAHALTHEASNSFLKALEEASANSLFILITSLPDNILPTIRSRSAIVRFKPSRAAEAARLLSGKYGMPGREAVSIAGFTGGRIGEALRMWESGEWERKNRVIDRARDLLTGGAGQGTANNEEWAYAERDDLRKDISFLVSWMRDIFVAKITHDSGLLYNADRADEIFEMSLKVSSRDLYRCVNRLLRLLEYVDYNVNTKIIVDSLLCGIGDMRKERSNV